MNSKNFENVSNRIAEYENEMIQMQRELTALPGLGPENGGDGEVERAAYLKPVLEKLNPDSLEEINAPDTRVASGYRPNLIAKFKGKSPEKTIWIMSHMDVVPAGDLSKWNTDPAEAVLKDGKLYGRGTEDNQQSLVGSIFAIKALRELNIVPEHNVGLMIVADEETGSANGLGHIIKNNPDLIRKDDLILVPDAGNEDGTMIEVAEKSILWIKFEIEGKQCHGSTPELGINAHRASANLVVRMDSLYQKFDLNDPVFDPPISTFEPTKKEANVPNINTIPGDDVIYFDCRILPNYPLKDVEAEIKRIVDGIEQEFKVKIRFSYPQKEEAAPATPVDAPVVKALDAAIQAVYQRQPQPMGIGGGTVAAFFRQAGYNAAVWSTIDDLAHQPNEYCVVASMVNDTRVFAHIFMQG